MAVQGFSGVATCKMPCHRKTAALLFAAGSLRTAMDAIMQAYRAQGGAAFKAKYDPSGKLRQEIEVGAKVNVSIPASTDYTQALAQQKKIIGGKPPLFSPTQ